MRSPVLVVLGGLAVIAAPLAACGASTPAPSPPSEHPSTPTAAPSTPATTSSRQAVKDAYLAFWPASTRAEKTGNARAARAVLARYVDPHYISFMISGMRSAWAKHEVGWGASVEHIQSIIVAAFNSGQLVAQVKDCQDDSHDGLASARTGALLPGTLGSAHQELYASLSLVNHHWLIEQVTFVSSTCKR